MAIGLVLLMLLAATAAHAAEAKATIQIDASQRGPKLNPRMYGIFLEEINHGVDGGLYGELVANRAFEDSRPPEGCTPKDGRWKSKQGWDSGFHVEAAVVPRWSLIREGGAAGSMHLETTGGLNENTPYCLRLDVEKAADGRIGIANEGFWGIGVREGEKYELTLYARGADGFAGPLTVTLEDPTGKPCSDAAKFDGVAAAWKPFRATLTGARTEPKARLAMAAGAAGKVWLDFVSLFPAKTFKGRANGLRADIAQMIADLKPGFIRFPGGCVVEGGNIETSYNWKRTVGPVEQRPECWNDWTYRRTHGMGLYEYLQFCDDLGAEPMHVGFAGQSCLYRLADHVPMEDMGWVVQNFLDVVEYANGPADTKWGGLRAKSGHPAPFGLKLIEIGNENGMKQYEERYRLIHKELKGKHSEITTIADYPIRDASYDLVDDHFYNAPQWFLGQWRHYDGRDRKLAPVYIGEIAVTSGEGGPDKGNLIAALAEGAFLMGAERNADVVRMVSYAPLLAHVSGRSGWHGMIYFDSLKSYGTVSYHLWKLFGLNRPSYTVKTDVEFTGAKQPAIAGAIGLGTWDTAAEFKDVRVEKAGQTLYASEFAKSAAGWKTEGGSWGVEDGAYRQKGNAIGLSWAGDETWSDYTLTLKARKLSGAEGFLVCFGRKGEDKYWWNIGGWGNRDHGIEFNRTPVGRRVAGKVDPSRWYDIKVELAGQRIRCYLDGKLIHHETAQGTQRFLAVAGRDEAGDLILKAINTSADPVATTLSLSGLARVAPEGEITVLRSDRLDDNNGLDHPTKVVPVTARMTGASAHFTHEFPPFSLTVMRLKAQ
jgi:alpha-L-arabinofuranosidase